VKIFPNKKPCIAPIPTPMELVEKSNKNMVDLWIFPPKWF
jgi:hypothetical protein